MLGKPSVSISGCLKSDFVSHVTHEGFYYQFLNEINTIGVLGELSKDDLKQTIFLVIYGRDTLVHVQDKKIKYPLQAFKKCYPDVMALYNALKKKVIERIVISFYRECCRM